MSKSGGGYGFRISKADRDQYLERRLGRVRFLITEPDVWAEANIDKDGFWGEHTVMIDKSLGQWFLHHHQPVHAAPAEGRIIRWEDAQRTFSPLCPTCHSLIHAKPGGGCFELDELRALI